MVTNNYLVTGTCQWLLWALHQRSAPAFHFVGNLGMFVYDAQVIWMWLVVKRLIRFRMTVPQRMSGKGSSQGNIVTRKHCDVRLVVCHLNHFYACCISTTRDNFTCCYCFQKLHPDKCTIDHIYPFCMKGPFVMENLLTCCHSCNGLKGCFWLLDLVLNTGTIPTGLPPISLGDPRPCPFDRPSISEADMIALCFKVRIYWGDLPCYWLLMCDGCP